MSYEDPNAEIGPTEAPTDFSAPDDSNYSPYNDNESLSTYYFGSSSTSSTIDRSELSVESLQQDPFVRSPIFAKTCNFRLQRASLPL